MLSICIHAQDHTNHVYKWDPVKDPAIMAGGILTWGTGKYLKSNSEKISMEDLQFRNPQNIWLFDRSTADNYSESADQISDILLYSTMALPFVHYSGKVCRDQGLIIGAMALETFFITDGITNITKALIKRYRPYTYNQELPVEEKLSSSARYSFVSGHTSNTAAFGFFTAKVYSDLYPDSKWKPLIWTIGAGVPAATAYLRYKAGKHFPTDVIAGYALGASIGYLIPHLHKINNEERSIHLAPSSGGIVLHFSQSLN